MTLLIREFEMVIMLFVSLTVQWSWEMTPLCGAVQNHNKMRSVDVISPRLTEETWEDGRVKQSGGG